MSNKSSIFALFSVLSGVLVFGIWSNIYAYAQQSSSPTLSPPPDSSLSKPISSELKTKMCDPSNPSLKVVNTTEARICGIPKTVKPPVTSAATPQTTQFVSSSSPSSPTQQTATTTKPTTEAAPNPKQQPVTTSNNNTNAISRPTGSASGATVSPVSQPTIKSKVGIAPQVNAVNGQQLPISAPQPITLINGTAGINNTAGLNYTFAATSPIASSDKLLYLGYHGGTKSSNDNSGSKHEDSTDSKPSTHTSTKSVSDTSSKDKDTKPTIPRIKITTDNDSTVKEKTSTTKSDDHSNSKHSDDSTSHKSTRNTDDSHPKDKGKSDPKPHTARTTSNDDSSDATSTSHNEDSSKSSPIDDHIPSVVVKSFNSKHSTDSDSSDEGGDRFFDGDKFFSEEGDGDF
jgi:hypothetical protein